MIINGNKRLIDIAILGYICLEVVVIIYVIIWIARGY